MGLWEDDKICKDTDCKYHSHYVSPQDKLMNTHTNVSHIFPGGSGSGSKARPLRMKKIDFSKSD